MEIKSLTLINFKNQDHAHYELKKVNHFFGDNFTGKSTIGDAIAYVLFGVTKFGYKLHTNEFVKMDKTNMYVQLDVINDGKNYKIKRERHGSKNRVMIDGVVAKDTEIEEIFGSAELFLYTFFLDTFPTLDKKEAREFIIKLLTQSGYVKEEATFDSMEKQLTAIRRKEKERKNRSSYYCGQQEVLKKQIEQTTVSVGTETTTQTRSLVEEEINQLTMNIQDNTMKLNQLQSEEKRLNNEKMATPNLQVGDSCPTCRQILFSEQLALLEEETSQKEANRTSELYRIRLEKEQVTEIISKYQQQLFSLKEKLYSLPVDETPNHLVKQWQQQVNDIEEKLHQLNLESTEDKNEASLIKAAIANLASKYQLVINQQLTRSSMILFQTLKNGELRPDFQLQYDGKPYRVLSTSEKMRCMLEVVHLISTLSETNYPVFIDNLESITHLEPPATQIITASVKKGSPLTLYSKE